MRFIIAIYISSVLFISQVWAGLPPTTSSGLLQSSKQTTFNYVVPNQQKTSLGGVNALLESGNYNQLINPSFEDATLNNGWTVGTTYFTPSSNTANIIDGLKSLALAETGTAGTNVAVLSQTYTASSAQSFVGFNMEATMRIRTSSLSAQSITASLCVDINGTQYSCAALSQTSTTFNTYTINFPGAAASSTYRIYIVFTSPGVSGATWYVDDAYLGVARNIASGVPNNLFSAKIAGSTGAISDLNQAGWITGACTPSSSIFNCTLASGLFTVAPNCIVAVVNASNRIPQVVSTTTTSVTFTTSIGGSSTLDSAQNMEIICTKAGSDYVQPAIGPNPVTYINDFGAQVSATGVVSNENFDFINANCTNANPSVCTFNTNIFTVTPNCTASPAITGVISTQITATSSSSVSVTTYNASGTPTQGAFSLACSKSGVDAKPAMNVPILVGSITSNASNALRDEYVILSLTGASTVTVSKSSSNWYTSFTATSSTITATWPSATWSDTPNCNATCNSSSGNVFAVLGTITTTGGAIICSNTSGAPTLSNQIFLRCIGPR